MILAVRRPLAGLLVGLVAGLGVQPAVSTPAHAASPSPTASATAGASATASSTATTDPSATGSPTATTEVNGDTSVEDTPDAAPDNSTTMIALGAAGLLALLAAAVVFLRRR